MKYIALLIAARSLKVQKYQSDNGNGTYINPVIPTDVPDPDVIPGLEIPTT